MKAKLIGIVLAALVLTASAYADPTCATGVCFILGDNHFADEQNILFKTAQTGTTIDGFTNQTDNEVEFRSSMSLTVQGMGQSGITPTSGNHIANLTITVPDGGVFTDFIINPHKTNTPANIFIQARTTTGAFFNSGFFGGMGNNFMTIVAAPGVKINMISMSSTSGVDTVSQTRISGLVVPEPSTMLLLGSSVLGLAEVLRRKRL